MSVDRKVLENVLIRSAGLLGIKRVEEVAKELGIKLLSTGSVEFSGDPDALLDALIRNIVAEGGVIAKIAIKNMSRQYNFPMPEDI